MACPQQMKLPKKKKKKKNGRPALLLQAGGSPDTGDQLIRKEGEFQDSEARQRSHGLAQHPLCRAQHLARHPRLTSPWHPLRPEGTGTPGPAPVRGPVGRHPKDEAEPPRNRASRFGHVWACRAAHEAPQKLAEGTQPASRKAPASREEPLRASSNLHTLSS